MSTLGNGGVTVIWRLVQSGEDIYWESCGAGEEHYAFARQTTV